MTGAAAGPVVTCPNCGRAFRGRFCPDCGQEDQDFRRPLREVAREFLGDFLAFDARLWRTLAPLIARPGRLTRDFLEGRRVRYVPPLRLYVFAGFVYFTVMALTGGGPFAPRISSGGQSAVAGVSGVQIEATPGPGTQAEGRFLSQVDKAARDRRAFSRSLIGALSYAHFLLMPVFALLLKAFYRRRYYAEHLIFSLHFHAFVLLPGAAVVALLALLPIDPRGPVAQTGVLAWFLAVAAYLYLALRRVYGGSRPRTAFKAAGLGLSYAMVASIGVMLVTVATIWFY